MPGDSKVVVEARTTHGTSKKSMMVCLPFVFLITASSSASLLELNTVPRIILRVTPWERVRTKRHSSHHHYGDVKNGACVHSWLSRCVTVPVPPGRRAAAVAADSHPLM